MGTALTVINQGHKPTFVTRTRPEVLNLSLVTLDLLDRVSGWHVVTETLFSDHKLIRFKVDLGNPKPVFYRNRRKTEWPYYTDLLKEKLRDLHVMDILSTTELENRVNLVTRLMVDSFQAACPLKQVRKKGPTHALWTPTLTELRIVARRKYRMAFEAGPNPNEAKLEVYRQAFREYKHSLRWAKRNSFREFCEDIKSLPAAARL